MRKKNKLYLLLAVLAMLCVPAHAEDSGMSMDEAMDIIHKLTSRCERKERVKWQTPRTG